MSIKEYTNGVPDRTTYGRGRHYISTSGHLRCVFDKWQTFGADHYAPLGGIKQGETVRIVQHVAIHGAVAKRWFAKITLGGCKIGGWGFCYGSRSRGRGGNPGTPEVQAGSLRYTLKREVVTEPVTIVRRNGRVVVKDRKRAVLALKPYVYHMGLKGRWGESAKTVGVEFTTGEWHELVTRVRWNTGTKKDGSYEVLLDGVPVASNGGVRWWRHVSPDQTVPVQLWLNGWRLPWVWRGKAWFDVWCLRIERDWSAPQEEE